MSGSLASTGRLARLRQSARFHALPTLALILPVFAIVSNKGIVPLAALCAVVILLAGKPFLAGLRARHSILPGLFISWSAATLLWTVDISVSLKLFALVATLTVGAFLLAEVEWRGDAWRQTMLRNGAVGCAAASLVMMLVYATEGLFLTALGSRADWWNVIKPSAAIVAMMLWPAAVYLWHQRSAWIAAFFLLGGALPVLLLNTKTAKVAVVIGAVVFLMTLARQRLVAWLMAASVGLLVMLAPVLAVQPMKHPHLVELMPRSGIHRLAIWDFVGQRIAERPILGWGFNSSRVIPGGNAQFGDMGEILPLHPHNGALQIWLELGFPGALMATAVLVLAALAIGRWERRAAAGALAAYAAAVAIGLSSFGIWQDWWLCSLVMVAVLCLSLRRAEWP